jgi:hypothetical protein
VATTAEHDHGRAHCGKEHGHRRDAQNAAADAVSKAFGSIDAKGIMNFDYIGAGLTGVAKGASLVASKFKEWANAIGGVDKAAEKEAKRYDDIINKANSRIASLSAEQAALGLSEFAAAKLKYETELLNQAQERGVTLTDARRATFSALASTMASVEIATKRTKEAIDFAKDATKGFISDLRHGLQNGEGFWKSFGNAALNVIDKIVDRIETNLVNALFDAGKAGSGGGFLSSIFGGLFGGGGPKMVVGGAGALAVPTFFAGGGQIKGAGTGTSDSNLIRASAGEYIVNAAATRRNLPLLEAINDNIALPGFKGGGLVPPGGEYGDELIIEARAA